VQRPPAQRVEGLVGRRGEQRVREPQALAVELDDVRGERGSKRLVTAGQCRHERQGRMRQRRRCRQHVLGRSGKRDDPPGHKLQQPLRKRRRPPYSKHSPLPVERPANLQREERIATRDGVHPPQRRQRKDHAQAAAQQAMHLLQLQWPNDHAPERLEALDGSRHGLPHPARQQHAHALLSQAPADERQHRGRGRIQPLHVVDREQQRAHDAERPRRRQHGHRHHALVQRRARPLQQERHTQRLGLRRRKHVEHLVEDAAEKITQPSEGEPRLRGRGARGEDATPALARKFEPRKPQRGLAHAGAALQRERRRTARDRVHELPELGALSHSANDTDRPVRHVRPTLIRSTDLVQSTSRRLSISPPRTPTAVHRAPAAGSPTTLCSALDRARPPQRAAPRRRQPSGWDELAVAWAATA
jgi:hypothetical protein